MDSSHSSTSIERPAHVHMKLDERGGATNASICTTESGYSVNPPKRLVASLFKACRESAQDTCAALNNALPDEDQIQKKHKYCSYPPKRRYEATKEAELRKRRRENDNVMASQYSGRKRSQRSLPGAQYILAQHRPRKRGFGKCHRRRRNSRQRSRIGQQTEQSEATYAQLWAAMPPTPYISLEYLVEERRKNMEEHQLESNTANPEDDLLSLMG